MSDMVDQRTAVIRALEGAFGGTGVVRRHGDETEQFSVDVLHVRDRPQRGLTSYATVGLSNHPLFRKGAEYPARTEIVGVCTSLFPEFADVIATAAFCIIKDRWFCAPGVMFPDVVRMYRPESPMKHLLFAPPFLWEDRLKTLHLDGRTIAWLLAVPISEPEMKFGEIHGFDALEALFEEKQIDIFAIDRPSVLEESPPGQAKRKSPRGR